MLYGISSNDRIRLLFGSKLVDEIKLFLVSDDVKAIIKELFDKFSSHYDPFLEILIVSILRNLPNLLESPQTSVSKYWTEIHFESLKEVLMRVVKHLVEQVLHLDSNHPRLLVIDETSRLVIQPVFAKGC